MTLFYFFLINICLLSHDLLIELWHRLICSSRSFKACLLASYASFASASFSISSSKYLMPTGIVGSIALSYSWIAERASASKRIGASSFACLSISISLESNLTDDLRVSTLSMM